MIRISFAARMPGDAAGVRAREASFLCGREQASLAACLESLSRALPCPFNPLTLHGPSGSGTSHAAAGLVGHWRRQLGSAAALSLSARDFAHERQEAQETKSLPDWRRPLLATQLLVIEDLHQLAATGAITYDAAEQELCCLLDERSARQLQTIATCAAAPQALQGLSRPLVNRLCGGLCLPLAYPALAVRMAFIAQETAEQGLVLQPGGAELLADQPPGPLATIRGALRTLANRHGPILAPEQIAEHLASAAAERPATQLKAIVAQTARQFSLRVGDLRGSSRCRSVSHARGVAMYLMRELAGCSLEQIGEYLGRRDHSTVLYGCRRTAELAKHDLETQHALRDIRERLEGLAYSP